MLGDSVSMECIPVLEVVFEILSLHCLGMDTSLKIEEPHAA